MHLIALFKLAGIDGIEAHSYDEPKLCQCNFFSPSLSCSLSLSLSRSLSSLSAHIQTHMHTRTHNMNLNVKQCISSSKALSLAFPVSVDALLSQSSRMSGMLYGVTHECLRHLRAARSSKNMFGDPPSEFSRATLKHASTRSFHCYTKC